ncbi:MAG: hypothetical protein EXS36_06910 [Pedosphaera sp.]|nr:hypothetical protein [Pedosphaera sp.]
MIKAWPSRADVIGMSLCVVVLWVSSAAPTMAADDEVWTLRDGTRDVEYERASEEVHLSGPALDRVVSAGPRGPRLSGLGVQEQWVLYPRGQDRTPLNRRVLTHRVIVELVPGADVAAVAREAGVGRWEGFDFSDTHFVLHSARGMASALELAAILQRNPAVIRAHPVLGRLLTPRFGPNDPLFPDQWTLKNTGQGGGTAHADVNIAAAWDKYRGRGVKIAVVDDGVDYRHPDLAANCQPALGYDYRDGDPDPIFEGLEGVDDFGNPQADSHGTCVAGVIGAVGNNRIGVCGAAFGATLVPVRLIGGNSGDDQQARALTHRFAEIAVSNNSWGENDNGTTIDGPGLLLQTVIQKGAEEGRSGRGTIYVWAAGNGARQGDNANNDGYVNSIYTVGVGALNDLGKRASYSEPGACLVISTPSGGDFQRPRGTLTTDLTGDFGYNHIGTIEELTDLDYTRRFNGTSAASPLAAGCIALMLEANPALGWRDVQEILMRTASKADPENQDWRTNKVGFHFNHEFGAGRLDASAAVEKAVNWKLLGAQRKVTLAGPTRSPQAIPDNNSNGTIVTLNITADIRVEHVTLDVNLQHESRGQLLIELMSPAGTVSRLFEPHRDSTEGLQFRQMSVFNWGERSVGAWKVRVSDLTVGKTGRIMLFKLTIFGSDAPPDVPLDAVVSLTRPVPSGDQISFSIIGTLGVPYRLERTPNLIEWTSFKTGTLGEDSVPVLDSLGAVARFYRVLKQ